jgi:hypothetical protein
MNIEGIKMKETIINILEEVEFGMDNGKCIIY